MKKNVLILSAVILSLTLFSFKSFNVSQVTVDPFGTYHVPEFGIVAEADIDFINQFETIVYGAKKTDVFHKTIDALKFKETIKRHKDLDFIPERPEVYMHIDPVMDQYLLPKKTFMREAVS